MKCYLILSLICFLFTSSPASAMSEKSGSPNPFDVPASGETATANQYIYAKTNLMGEDVVLQFAGADWKVNAVLPREGDGPEALYGFTVEGSHWKREEADVGLVVRFDKKYISSKETMIEGSFPGIVFFESQVIFPFSGELMLYKNGDRYFKISLSPME